ncbi:MULTISPECIES: serine/threonine-protein kinase [Nocardioides]|uniref:non-specific serine/threonine protein kinase n=1 Tax=Nocardioides vastitatis TaxID=2568655 RepID=A0ABW0ZP09_9ACTN|nr:serine/threonine-protein kinase [Nocardioides sp.]THJ01776.1 serine/threonine protein kinase [Nocardioides sp.]
MSEPGLLGRYAVRRRIGSGAFATVWLAFDDQLESPVAVKVLAENWSGDDHVRRRFLAEGRLLRKVESPHVVTVYDAGELDDGRPYLVMTYADQGTLADRLELDAMSAAQALEVVRQVGLGLQTLHDRAVLHRDVKPANVLFRTVDGRVRAMVADLGLGKAMDVSSRLTLIAGTPSYVAPEQALGEPLDARADQYSLAALTYLLLTGRPPYAHASLVAASTPGPLPPLSTDERTFPAAVDAVVSRGLAVDREERYPDVTAYVEALADALGDVAAEVPQEPWLPLDPDLTQPGARPSLFPDDEQPVLRPGAEPASAPVQRRPGRRMLLAALTGLVAVGAGVGAGYVVARVAPADDSWAEVSDQSGSLSVSVPPDWDRAATGDGWRPLTEDRDYPALSVGTSASWTSDSAGEGAFLGILGGASLPEQVPQHPECGTPRDPVTDSTDDGAAVTVLYPDCPGGVTVERVVQVADNRLLWVQVRSRDTATANRVLDSVQAHGFR